VLYLSRSRRKTKEAETDNPNLPLPRHISALLPWDDKRNGDRMTVNGDTSASNAKEVIRKKSAILVFYFLCTLASSEISTIAAKTIIAIIITISILALLN
jgi:hypothetical protein